MATFNNGESGSSVRAKINAVLQHADGTSGELVINDAGADVDFRVESDTNPNAFFLDGATGNVGIGTSSPAYKLDVATIPIAVNQSGSVRFGASDQYGMRLNQATTGVGAPYAQVMGPKDASGWLAFTLGTTDQERMRIDASGNVGIGVSPSARLHVYNATGGTVARLQTGTTANGNFLDFQNAASARQGIVGFIDSANLYIHNDAAAAIIFDTSNTERMRIDSSGNLLIGTSTSGGSKLRISGLPTSSAGLSAGDVWNDGGTLKIV